MSASGAPTDNRRGRVLVRRIPACLFVVAALALLAPAVAFAATNDTHPPGAWTGAVHSPLLLAKTHSRAAVALAAGSYTISGTVLDGQGDATTGADVSWGWMDPVNGYQPGGDSGVLTGDAFSLKNVSSSRAPTTFWRSTTTSTRPRSTLRAGPTTSRPTTTRPATTTLCSPPGSPCRSRALPRRSRPRSTCTARVA